jgi:hypothetical protein
MSEHFDAVQVYPPPSANGVLLRLIDSLGYRFYWATDGLTADDETFSPGSGAMSIGDLIAHIRDMFNWIHRNVLDAEWPDGRPSEVAGQREQALEILHAIRDRVAGIDEQALFELTINGHPFWHLINGPLSDALTHVGQINAFRRLNGNPVCRHAVFFLSTPQDRKGDH